MQTCCGVPEAPSPRVERSVSEAYYSPCSSIEVKNTWIYTATLQQDLITYSGQLYLLPFLHKQFRGVRSSAEEIQRVGTFDE
jgi:hypothetical protein